ncbi:hypothetical protein E4U24_003382 [Claviceps purpurea]|nr:hypothetical protein E4U24_003382 [Claviceps purpurea]
MHSKTTRSPRDIMAQWTYDMPWPKVPSHAQATFAEAVLTAFAGMEPDMVLDHLQIHQDGLSDEQADVRRSIKGPNILPTHNAPSWIITPLKAILNPFNILLIALAEGFAVLVVMVFISVLVHFWQEYRSSVTVFKLQASVSTDLKVRRQRSIILDQKSWPADLVPGDIVILSPGSVVSADCLILESSFIRISQSTWTGENDPVPKTGNVPGEKGSSFFDLSDIAFMGTSVISGNGVALVLEPDAALYSISVAVGLVPEMPPAIVSANLARSRLDLVQNLGAMRVLCSDKTGTLTKDKITLSHYIDYTGETTADVLKLVTVDSVVQSSNGNNIDGAIIEHRMADGRSINTAQYKKVVAIPLNFERRRSAMLATRTNRLNREGFRVLLVAEKDIAEVDLRDEDSLQELETNMVLEGYVLEVILGIIDPPKDDAAQSIVELKDLGEQTEVLTGDTLPVAVNVCQHLELISRFVTENDDVQAITGPELTKRPPSQAVFASQATVWACSATASTTAWRSLRRVDAGISVDSGTSCVTASIPCLRG